VLFRRRLCARQTEKQTERRDYGVHRTIPSYFDADLRKRFLNVTASQPKAYHDRFSVASNDRGPRLANSRSLHEHLGPNGAQRPVTPLVKRAAGRIILAIFLFTGSSLILRYRMLTMLSSVAPERITERAAGSVAPDVPSQGLQGFCGTLAWKL
jgi:hypothetical protein